MLVNQKEFYEIDTREKITIPDCSVNRSNKLGTANGERKLYVGDEGELVRNFFGPKGFIAQCFFLKSDLLKFLNDLKSEYKQPQLPYRKKETLPALFEERLLQIKALPEIVYFKMVEQAHLKPPRVYVNSVKDKNYLLLGDLSLPNLSYLSIRKLRANDGEVIFYARLFSDYLDAFGQIEHPVEMLAEQKLVEENPNLSIDQKLQLVKARVGQGKYRKNLLEECRFCPITHVSDDRLLIASHIKPWSVSNQQEKTDPKNGFMFTPTIDYLFDQGFITFEPDKRLIVSPWISNTTISRLNLKPKSIVTELQIEGREKYLVYHRDVVFKQ
jgi:putative restriction endonuclease